VTRLLAFQLENASTWLKYNTREKMWTEPISFFWQALKEAMRHSLPGFQGLFDHARVLVDFGVCFFMYLCLSNNVAGN
jgi:hypothetical protein